MKRLGWSGVLLGIGALGMYFFDPDRGRRRRVTLKDCLVHCGYESRKFLGRFRRDLRHRAEGTLADTMRLFHHEEISDAVLEPRVRSALGRAVLHPHAVEVRCKDGTVEVSGRVMAWEADSLRPMIESIPGVKGLSICVQTSETSEQIPNKDWEKRQKPLGGFFGNRWPPAARGIVAATGAALILHGLRRRRSVTSLPGIAGGLLLARSALNMPLRSVSRAGIRVEKTMRVRAPRDQVFAFWTNPENYAKVFSHVKRVVPEGEGVYRWHGIGPAGIPVNWTGKITRQVPGRSIEWQSLPGSAVENHGVIRLDDESNRGTRVHVRLEYRPPAGLLGHAFAALLGIDPVRVMHHEFVLLQSVLERGVTRAHGHQVTVADLGITPPAAAGQAHPDSTAA